LLNFLKMKFTIVALALVLITGVVAMPMPQEEGGDEMFGELQDQDGGFGGDESGFGGEESGEGGDESGAFGLEGGEEE
jgi:hypothetical protein